MGTIIVELADSPSATTDLIVTRAVSAIVEFLVYCHSTGDSHSPQPKRLRYLALNNFSSVGFGGKNSL